jgi:hypothetical protein
MPPVDAEIEPRSADLTDAGRACQAAEPLALAPPVGARILRSPRSCLSCGRRGTSIIDGEADERR